jgi:sugar lactone lactonase YvrE
LDKKGTIRTITCIEGTKEAAVGLSVTDVRVANIFGLAVDAKDNLVVCLSSDPFEYPYLLSVLPEGTILQMMGRFDYTKTKVPSSGLPDNVFDPSISGLAYGPDGTLFAYGEYQVQKMDRQGHISLFYKNASAGFAGIAVDAEGNIYLSDVKSHRIWKVDPKGHGVPFAGMGVEGVSGDGGPALKAFLRDPRGLALDRSGNLYIADRGNSRVRKVDRKGILTTVAGSGNVAEDNVPATRSLADNVTAVVVDSEDNLYLSDPVSNCIRKVDHRGIITTVVGRKWQKSPDVINEAPGITGGDGGQAIDAIINFPGKMVIDSKGNLYFIDASFTRVRKVSGIAAPGLIAGRPFPQNRDRSTP